MDTDSTVESVDITDADGQLGDLLAKIVDGGRVRFVRDGVPVAWLTSAEPPSRRRITMDELNAATAGMTFQTESAGDFMRRMRDEERY